MPATQIPSPQIGSQAVQRTDLCVSGANGTNVVAKIVGGSGVSLGSTGGLTSGADPGTGDVTVGLANIAVGSVLGLASGAGPGAPVAVTAWTNPPWLTSIPWTKITATPTTLSGYGIASPLPAAQGGTGATTGAEPPLGNPGVNGQVLSSTTAGVRSWITPAGGGTIGGSIATSQIAFGSGSNTIQGSGNFLFDASSNIQLAGTGTNYLRIGTNSGVDMLIASPFGTSSINQNAYYSGGWKYDKAGAAAQIQFSGGSIDSHLAASGAAAGAITWVSGWSAYLSGGVSFGTRSTIDPGAGYIDVTTGYKIGGVVANVPAGGAAGTGLYKNTATNFDFAWQAPTTLNGTPAAPAGTVSTVGVMCGLAQSFTPQVTGKVLIIVTGRFATNVAGAYGLAQICYGTGTAPANGAAATGTLIGTQCWAINALTISGVYTQFTCVAVVTMTMGTAYWIDLKQTSSSSSATLSISNLNVNAMEI